MLALVRHGLAALILLAAPPSFAQQPPTSVEHRKDAVQKKARPVGRMEWQRACADPIW